MLPTLETFDLFLWLYVAYHCLVERQQDVDLLILDTSALPIHTHNLSVRNKGEL